ncbi:MAG: thiamine phosphate synthase [Roseinatronobacter sp.]
MRDDQPQIYLITPPVPDLDQFPAQLARVLDGCDVACVRMTLASQDEDTILRTGDVLREIAHARDVPLVIADHVLMVERLGLDGVHLTGGHIRIRKLREALGPEAIIGAWCGTSRHDGLTAGEAGADYVSFGPAQAGALGDGAEAAQELFAWWSEMIELPVVAEGNLGTERIAALASVVDFVALGAEIWGHDDPLAQLKTVTAPLR